MKPSVAAGRAPVCCPMCLTISSELDDTDALATIGGASDERGSYALLDAFWCPRGHEAALLSLEEEHDIIQAATEWLEGAREALQDSYNDAQIDRYREEAL